MRHWNLIVQAALGLVLAVPAGWTPAPVYARLFGPAGVHRASYRAFTSPLPLADVLARVTADPSALHPPGAWTAVPQLPGDAFGLSGLYDRLRLARLYGAGRAMVARGPRGESGRPAEAWTLISPDPDPAFDRLESGTLLIVLDLSQE